MLANFKIDPQKYNQFKQICTLNNVSMSGILNTLITLFISDLQLQQRAVKEAKRK